MMLLDPVNGSASDIVDLVSTRQISARDVVRRSLERIIALDGVVRAVASVDAERALADAATIDARLAAGERLPLAGVPFGVASRLDPVADGPAGNDALAVERLRDAGAVRVATLVSGEDGGEDGDGVRNPHDLARWSGSGGAAAAVAGGMLALSVAVDVAGSARLSAARNGVFALTPTFGRLGRRGLAAVAPSLDAPSVFARSVADLALAFDALQGPDPADDRLADRPRLDTADDLDYLPHGLGVVRAAGWFDGAVTPPVRRAVETVIAALLGPGGVGPTGGSYRGDVDLAGAGKADAAAALIAAAESAALAGRDLPPPARARVLAGAMLPAAWVTPARRFAGPFAASVASAFRDVDVLVAPAAPSSAPLRLARPHDGEPAADDRRLARPFALAGLPTVTLPVWPAGERLPVGVLVAAAPWREDVALKVARRLELLGAARAPIALIEAGLAQTIGGI